MNNERSANGDSIEQIDAGKLLISAFSKEIGVKLQPNKRLPVLDKRSWLELDGYSESPSYLCEAWVHMGISKGAQLKKVMTDAFKLLYAKTLINPNKKSNLVLLFADREAASYFQGKSWMAQCLKKYDIKVKIIKLPQNIETGLKKAQKRQYR